MNLQDQRGAFSFFVAGRADEQSFDVHIVRLFPLDHSGPGQREISDLRIDPGDLLSLIDVLERRDPDVVRRKGIVDGVGYLPSRRVTSLTRINRRRREAPDLRMAGDVEGAVIAAFT